MMVSVPRTFLLPMLLVLSSAFVTSCSSETKEDASAKPGAVPEEKAKDVLVFPTELHVADRSVNEFITHAMHVCGSGDYESFRLLWTAQEDPLPRAQFEEGWQAVQEIRVRAVEPAVLATDGAEEGQNVYIVLAHVRFDPDHPAGRKEPVREVVLLVVREHEKWSLAHAPNIMRKWVREKVSGEKSSG